MFEACKRGYSCHWMQRTGTSVYCPFQRCQVNVGWSVTSDRMTGDVVGHSTPPPAYDSPSPDFSLSSGLP